MNSSMPHSARTGSRRRAKKVSSNKKTVFRIIGLCAAAVLVIFMAVFGAMSSDAFAGDKIVRGVSVDGILIGGMTQQQALEALKNDALNPYESSSVTLYAGEGHSVLITGSSVDAHVDYEATVRGALSVAKSNNILSDMFEAFVIRLFKRDIPSVAVYDQTKLDEQLIKFAEEVGGTLEQHKIDVGEKEVLITPGKPGLGIDLDIARAAFHNNLAARKQVSVEVKLTDADPADIDIEELYKMTYRAPVDAHYERSGGSVIVVAHKDGREIDKQQAAAALKELRPGGPPIKIPYITLAASVTENQLNKRFFADTLGSFSTKYVTANKTRSNNIAIATSKINGTILLPGEEFSYNKTVGPRTYERGFQDASIYENNRMVDGVGGGICQVSSTLYAAVLYADLQVVERHEHSLEIHYAPLGMDATVAWGSLDFRFKNNTGAPLKIVATASGGVNSIKIMGTNPNPGRVIKINTEVVSTTPYTVREIPDPNLPAGKRVEESVGFKGHVVNTYKVIYQNGKQIESKFLHKSVYTMAPKVVRVGTGPAPQTPVPSIAPPEDPVADTTPGPAEEPAASPAPTSVAATSEPGSVSTPPASGGEPTPPVSGGASTPQPSDYPEGI